MRTDILEKKDVILQWVAEGKSKAFICRELKCKPETLNSYLKKMDIQYDGNKGLKGQKQSTTYLTAEEYIHSTCVKSHILKQKLIRDGIKKHQCERCGLSIWNNQPIPLELHHKDGDHYNNEISNLEILCPNCHAQESNNSGAATKNTVAL